MSVSRMKQTKIALNSPGLVVFDPQVLQAFITSHNIQSANILESFINDPVLGSEAVQNGALLTIYSITPWDYRVILSESGISTVNPDWVLFESPAFVLHVTSGHVIVSDIWAILNWDEEFYCNYETHPLPDIYAAAEAQVSDQLPLPNGHYEVKIVGFCDRANPNVEERECGYELLLTPNDNAAFEVIGTIDAIDFDVIGLPAE